MGLFGSAFSANIKDIIRIQEKEIKEFCPTIYNMLALLESTQIAQTRLMPATVPNFTLDFGSGPLKNSKTLALMDAGIDHTIPLFLDRADIIFIMDASSSLAGAPELKKAEARLKKAGVRLPKIDYKNIDQKRITIFKDNNLKTPIIVYMPLINENGQYNSGYNWKNKDYAKTISFKQTNKEFDELFGLAEFNVIQSKNKIIEAINMLTNF